MNSDELRAKFTAAYKIIQLERKRRDHEGRNDPVTRAQKVAEMDKVLSILTELKDELKPHCEAGYEQPRLLDAPKKADYQ